MRKLTKIFRCLSEPSYRRSLFKYRVAAAVEHEGVLSALSHCKTVLDVGANRGQFALVALRHIKDARVYCFEPLAKPACELEGVLEVCRTNRASVARVAIGTRNGSVEMHVAARDDSSSLLPITQQQSRLFPGTQEIRTEVVDVRDLPSALSSQQFRKPALLKIDVQGAELDVLKASESMLDQIDYVYVECSFLELYEGQALACDVIDWLQRRNMFLMGVFNPSNKAGAAIQADFLFCRTGANGIG